MDNDLIRSNKGLKINLGSKSLLCDEVKRLKENLKAQSKQKTK